MEKRLTADLNVVANSNLEIQLLDGDLNIIQKLDDEPNDVGGLTSAELKAKFDESGNIIKKYINETLIPAVLTDDATEESRKQAEAARVAAEQGRVTAEEGRVSAEAARAAAEQARSEAEASRVSAENARAAAETARADETAGIVARATAQANAAASSASQAAGSEQSAKDAAGTATGAASSASQSAAAASGSASQASAAAAAAAQSAASVDGINKTAQSWAVGGTGTRPGEDTDNAKYWAQQAAAAVGGDFATKTEAQGYVSTHNQSDAAHPDIREALNGKAAGKHASQHGAKGSDPITPTAIGAVGYDAAQNLTDDQKTQARGNIGAGSASELAKKPNALLAYTILHVAKTGSDTTGDGSEAKPFLTIQKAVNSLPRLLMDRVSIMIHAGAYEENVYVGKFTGNESLNIKAANGETVDVKTVDIGTVCLAGGVSVIGLTLTGTSNDNYNWSLRCQSCNAINIESVTCTGAVPTASLGAFRLFNTADVYIANTVISNKPIALDITGATVYLNNTVTGTGNTVGIRCGSGYGTHGGFVQKGGASIAGEEQKYYGGQIW